MTCRNVSPMSSSMRPLYFRFPAMAQVLTPLALGVPNPAYQSAPLRMMGGTVAQVSALLSSVGRFHNPFSVECGGWALGKGRLPSMDAISAVDSPPMNASMPSWMEMSMEKSVPRMLSPSRLRSLACSMAMLSRFTAMA